MRNGLLVGLILLSARLGAAEFIPLGDLPGGNFDSSAQGVSDDGTVVAGYGAADTGGKPFRWTAATGMVDLGSLPGGGESGLGYDVSADGNVVVGYSSRSDGRIAFRWTPADGMYGIGYLGGGDIYSSAAAVSADGQTIVGDSEVRFGFQAFRWTQSSGMAALPARQAHGVSDDGSIVVGYNGTLQQGFRWTEATGAVPLGTLPGGLVSRATAVTGDGKTIVGSATSGSAPNPSIASYSEAVIWSEVDGIQGLGYLSGDNSSARDVSSNGNIVVGQAEDVGRPVGFIWTPATGMQNYNDYLESLGVDLGGYEVQRIGAISRNGQYVVGTALRPDGDYEAFIATGVAPVAATLTSTLATLAIDNPAANPDSGRFGGAVSILGDKFVVGAPSDDSTGTNAGRAYLYDAIGGARLQIFENPTPDTNDAFGHAVSISGNRVVVGVPSDDTTGTDSGSAYVFDANTGALLHTLANPAAGFSDDFGWSVSIDGDRIAVGARGDGLAYLFDATTGAHLTTYIPPGSDDLFGGAISLDDGRVLIGAAGVGEAYLYDAETATLLHTFANPAPPNTDAFGGSASLSGDRVLVGAYNDDTGATDTGRAYLFDASNGALVHSFDNPSPDNGDRIGWWSASVSGDQVLLGAFADDTTANDAGRAYVFDAVSGALTHTLENPAPDSGDNFGIALSISDHRIVVGAYQDDATANNSGRVYLFSSDTDSDGMSDDWEAAWGFDRNSSADAAQDLDSDILINLDEYRNFTNPNDSDSDNDGLIDGPEVLAVGSDPLNSDTDTDGLTDGFETNSIGSNPLDYDTDGDTIDDLWEVTYWVGPLNPASAYADPDNDGLDNLGEYNSGTLPLTADTDGDWIRDGFEVNFIGTNPLSNDTDADTMPDFWEAINWVGPTDPTSGANNPDGDAYTNLEEFQNGTNPNSADP